MRTALIVGIAVSGEQRVMLAPGDPRTATDTFKRFIVAPPEGVAEIQLWESGAGIIKRKRFQPVEQSPSTASASIPPVAENATGGDADDQPAVPVEDSLADAPSLIPDEQPRKRR